MSDQNVSVDSEGPGPRRPRSSIVLAAGVAGLALGLLIGVTLSRTGEGSEATPTSLPTAAVTSAPATAPRRTFPVQEVPASETGDRSLGEYVEGLEGRLVTVLASDPAEIMVWHSSQLFSTISYPLPRGICCPTFDAAKRHIAAVGPSASLDMPVLYAGEMDSVLPVLVGVASYAWSTEIPTTLAATVEGDTGRSIYVLPADEGALGEGVLRFGEPRYFAEIESAERLEAWDEFGFLLSSWDDSREKPFLRRLEDSGQQVALAGFYVTATSPDGTLLLTRYTEGEDPTEEFWLSDPLFTEMNLLGWAPLDVRGEYRGVAFSPDGEQLGFLVYEGGDPPVYEVGDTRWALEIYRTDGTLNQRVPLDWRV